MAYKYYYNYIELKHNTFIQDLPPKRFNNKTVFAVYKPQSIKPLLFLAWLRNHYLITTKPSRSSAHSKPPPKIYLARAFKPHQIKREKRLHIRRQNGVNLKLILFGLCQKQPKTIQTFYKTQCIVGFNIFFGGRNGVENRWRKPAFLENPHTKKCSMRFRENMCFCGIANRDERGNRFKMQRQSCFRKRLHNQTKKLDNSSVGCVGCWLWQNPSAGEASASGFVFIWKMSLIS